MICINNSYFNTIDEFKETNPAHKLIKEALKELLPTKGNRSAFFLSLFFGIVLSIQIGRSEETVKITLEISDTILTVQLAIFSCVFAVYSILLAFLSEGYMKRLASVKHDDKESMLKKSTLYYESVLFLYFINIGITGLVLIGLKSVDPTFRLTNNYFMDTMFAIVFLFLYFSFTFRVFYELKSTIYNTITLFRASIAYKFLDFASKEKEKETGNDNNK